MLSYRAQELSWGDTGEFCFLIFLFREVSNICVDCWLYDELFMWAGKMDVRP